jgi:sugar/nucleoside kinase (ribokinase family)
VETDLVAVDPTRPTGVFAKEVREDGARRVYYYRAGSAASALDESDVFRAVASGPTVVAVSGLTAALGEGPRRAVAELGRLVAELRTNPDANRHTQLHATNTHDYTSEHPRLRVTHNRTDASEHTARHATHTPGDRPDHPTMRTTDTHCDAPEQRAPHATRTQDTTSKHTALHAADTQGDESEHPAVHVTHTPDDAERRLSTKAGQAQGVLLALDPNLRPGLAPVTDLLRELLPVTSFLLLGIDEAGPLLGTEEPGEVFRRAAALGVGEVVLKAGADGCWYAGADGPEHLPSAAVQVVDPVGAGDAFAGAYLAARLRGIGPRGAAWLGTRFAAGVVAAPGDTDGLPDADEAAVLLEAAHLQTAADAHPGSD